MIRRRLITLPPPDNTRHAPRLRDSATDALRAIAATLAIR